MAVNVSYYDMSFSTSQARGLIVVPTFALLSALALSFIVFRCIRLVVIPSFQGNVTTPKAPENLFFRTHLGHYAASLVFSNVVLTSAGLMEFFWVNHSGIYHGTLCNVQAALMQTGSWATCFFSVAIGLHTCSSLVFRLRQINWMSVAVIAFGWIISLVIGLGPLSSDDVYGPVIVACGVTLAHPDQIIGLKSFPVLFGAILAVLVYFFIFLVLRGFLRVTGGIKFTLRPQEGLTSNNSGEYARFLGAIANSMFWYPVAFVLLLLPFTIANVIQFRGQTISFGFDVFVHACWSILGLVNVALLYNTFRVLNPVYHNLTLPRIQADTEKSFGNDAFDGSPILPPAAHNPNPKGPLLPLYRENEDSKPLPASPISLSEFPEVKQHSRNSSVSSADSSTQLLSIKRKPSRYHSMRVKMQSLSQTILPTAELRRQLSDLESIKGHNLQLDLPVAEVKTAKPTPETISLSPAPRSAIASVIGPSQNVPTPTIPTTSPMRQITVAFGRPKRKSKFGPRSKGSTAILPVAPPLSPIPSLESATSMPEISAVQSRESSTSATGEKRPPRLDLTGITPTVPVRPLPVITAEVVKGKDGAPTPPEPFPVKKDVTSGKFHPRRFFRPLPQFPRHSAGSSSSSEVSHHSDLDESLLSVSSFLSLPSPQPSLESTHTRNTSIKRAREPTPQTGDNTSGEEDSADSEHSSSISINTRRQDLPSKRMTQTSMWSQESPATASQPPDIEAALAQICLQARS